MSVLFHATLVLLVLVGVARLALDQLWRRRLEDVAALPPRADVEWLDAALRAIDNDREIISGYLGDVVELQASDPAEATRRLGFAREQVEASARPDFLETLAVVWRLLAAVPVAPEPRSWPESCPSTPAGRVVRLVARVAGALALTSKDRTRVRLWLVRWTFWLTARAFVEWARGTVEGDFEREIAPSLTRAAETLRQAQLALANVAEDVLLARARRERWDADQG